MADGYLPPIIVDILGRDSDLISKIEESKAAIASMDDEHATPTISANTGPLDAKLAEADAELDAIGAKVVSPTIAPHVSTAASLASAAQLAALSRGMLNDYASLAGIAGADKLANKSAVIDALVAGDLATQTGGGGKGGGGGGNGIAAALAAAAGGAMWGGGGGGFIASLLSPLTMISTLFSAGFGTLGSFAGFGPEHLAMTGIGLAGSAVGGGLGAGLAGLGALGVEGVGLGTDLAGIGQAGGDIKTVYGDMNALSQAVAIYGKSSTQAAAAQGQLNFDLGNFNPVARSAVQNAAEMAVNFTKLFDKWTGGAEATGAAIISQAIQTAGAFVPTIGKFAAENMVIIQRGLQPVFQWLQGPGLRIFQDLEQQFTSNLPVAMDAFNQGLQFVIKTIDVASHYTGSFIVKLDEFFTKWNSGPGFAKWSADIGKLIGDFHMWTGLIKAAGDAIYNLFTHDAGTAKAIVTDLTNMLDRLTAWEKSTQGGDQLHNVFEAHKQQILDLLNLLPSLVKGFSEIYLNVAPALTMAFARVLSAITPVIVALSKNPVGAWVIGLTILAGRFGLLSSMIGPLIGLFGNLAKAMAINTLNLAGIGNLAGPLGLVKQEAAGASGAVAGIGEDAAAAGAATEVSALGMLGPIGLVVGAVAGVTAAWVALEHHAPSIGASVAKGFSAMNTELAQLPTGNVLQIQVDLGKINGLLGTTATELNNLKPGSDALAAAAGASQALYEAQINLNRQTSILNGNVNTLSKTFHISTGDVQTFANQVGVNLKAKLSPTDIQAIGSAVFQSGEAFDRAATKPPHWAQSVAANAAKAVQANEASNQTLNADSQIAMQLHQVIMQNGGAIAIANFVNAQNGGLPRVRAVANQYGVTIPNAALQLLQGSMTKGGTISMTNLATSIGNGAGKIVAAMGHVNQGAISAVNQLGSAFQSAGVNATGLLAYGIQVGGGRAIAAAASVAATISSYVSSALASASQIGAAANASAAALVRQTATKAALAASAPGGHATGTSYFTGGLTWVGERGPELVALPTGSKIFPADQSASMAGSGMTINIQANTNASARAISEEVAWVGRRMLAGMGH